jgi:hypothetical protein
MDSQAELHHEIQLFLKRKKDENRSLTNLIRALNTLSDNHPVPYKTNLPKNHKP